jgi:high-affinity Fe2+/Pb2+ permease
MRCETCQRPIITNHTKRNLWVWSVIITTLCAIFFAGLLVETVANIDLAGFLAVIAGYAAGVGVMLFWWHIAAKDY